MRHTIMRVVALVVVVAAVPATSMGDKDAPAAVRQAVDALVRAAGKPLRVRLAPATGTAALVSAPAGGGIPVATAASAPAPERARAFLGTYGAALGLGPDDEVAVDRISGSDEVGLEHVRLQQMVRGVPVTGTRIGVHLRNAAVTAVTAKTVPDAATVDTTPVVSAADALLVAERLLAESLGEAAGQLATPRLEIFNRGLLEGGMGRSRLAWFVEASTPSRLEYIWVDAQTAEILLHFNQRPDALSRLIYDAGNSGVLPGTLVRVEGDPATGNALVDNLYDYTGATYAYFLSEHGRDSFDGFGASMIGSVRYCAPGCGCPCLNAYWNGAQTIYGETFAVEDIVAHEWTHGVTQYEAGLFYYMQSGALNESYSDVFGETVDLLSPGGNDNAAVRWGIGEDTFPAIPGFGGFRNMMDPTLAADPDRVGDILRLVCNDGSGDAGGVHSNSGINNHAYALMVDGGTYNGFNVTGIGLTKAGKVMYRALTQYLAPTSTFTDNDAAIRQACSDLIGVAGITAADCVEVGDALDAVEMAAPWPCLAPGCAAAPSQYCKTPGKSALRFKHDPAGPAKDKFAWKWRNGTTTRYDFGDPVNGDPQYALCVYRDGALAMTATVDPGGSCDGRPCWSATSKGTYIYRLRTGNADSITGVKLAPGTGNAKVQVKGKGSGLGPPGPMPLGYSSEITVQLGRSYAGHCWSSTYPAPARTNSESSFGDSIP